MTPEAISAFNFECRKNSTFDVRIQETRGQKLFYYSKNLLEPLNSPFDFVETKFNLNYLALHSTKAHRYEPPPQTITSKPIYASNFQQYIEYKNFLRTT